MNASPVLRDNLHAESIEGDGTPLENILWHIMCHSCHCSWMVLWLLTGTDICALEVFVRLVNCLLLGGSDWSHWEKLDIMSVGQGSPVSFLNRGL